VGLVIESADYIILYCIKNAYSHTSGASYSELQLNKRSPNAISWVTGAAVCLCYNQQIKEFAKTPELDAGDRT
jgi:hypothetical protein